MFEIIAPTVEEIGRSGNGRITVKINGYWSHDPITVYIRRGWGYLNNDGKWEMTVSHSSGGRDTKQVSDDLEASYNFANAMLALIEFSRKFFDENVNEFENHYQQMINDRRKEEDEAKRLSQEKLENDSVIGMDGATKIVNQLIEKFNTNNPYSREVEIRLRMRGNNILHTVSFKNHGKASFKLCHHRVPKEELIKKISEYAEMV